VSVMMFAMFAADVRKSGIHPPFSLVTQALGLCMPILRASHGPNVGSTVLDTHMI
jgi:hypothetical protein